MALPFSGGFSWLGQIRSNAKQILQSVSSKAVHRLHGAGLIDGNVVRSARPKPATRKAMDKASKQGDNKYVIDKQWDRVRATPRVGIHHSVSHYALDHIPQTN